MEAKTENKILNILLWIVQILVGLTFIMAGLTKSTQPISELAKSTPHVTQFPQLLIRFIGLSELLGGIGVILPSIIAFRPRLTPIAALGLVIIMILASVFHIVRMEIHVLPIPVIMGFLAYFIYWGRTKKIPIVPRR